MKDRTKFLILVLLALLVIGLYLSLGLTPKNYKYALSRRVPKVIAIVATAFSIAVSTGVFQTVTNNNILTPSVMGLDSLYLLIQTLIVFGLGSSSRLVVDSNLNFLLNTGLMILFSVLLFKVLFRGDLGSHNIFRLLLIGMIAGTFFQSLSSFMQMIIDPNEFLVLQGRMFASFNSIDTGILTVSLSIMALVFVVLGFYLRKLDVVALGRDHAINLGVDYDKLVQKMLVLVSILVSVSTGLVGPITFLGLMVVNVARQVLKKVKHGSLLLASSLLGVVALIGGQLLVERVLNFAAPISVLINFVGGTYFIYLMLREKST